MGEEVTFLAKYAPYYIPILSAVILIIFTKNYLFRGMISVDVHQSQVDREREIIKVQETVANQLCEIVRQLESLTRTVSEEIKENTDRLRTLELVFSDNIDAVRELAINCEKHRKNIPDTEMFTQPRKKP
jgi:hypothetical protein